MYLRCAGLQADSSTTCFFLAITNDENSSYIAFPIPTICTRDVANGSFTWSESCPDRSLVTGERCNKSCKEAKSHKN